MKTFKIFSTAALALMMAACSSEDAALNNSPAQQQGRKVHFTATIAAPGGNAGTRTEYTEVTEGDAAGTINVAWKAKDEIALIHNGTKDVVTVETVNEDGSATITGDITVGTNGEAVEVCYPAAAWEWYAEKSCAIRNETFVTNITTKQDGTLKYIQDNLDTRMGEGKLKVDGDKATLSDNVKLASQIAIWKLTLLDGESNVLQATQVKIKGGTSVLASTATIAATSEVTLAIPTDVAIDGALTIEATVGSDTYAYTKEEGVTFDRKYYQSKVTMAPAATDLSKLTGDYTAKNGETLTGKLARNYMISIAKGATVTLDGVTITGENNSDYKWAGITCEGNATIILKDDTENTVNGFHQNYPGIYVPSEMTLTIKGETKRTGKLTASSNGGGAGIGGGQYKNCGNIEIQGGVITATGSSYAAGIGGANSSTCGSITISGGAVTAKGGQNGAGIGSGSYTTCGSITISGGTVTATGGDGGAGIGSGFGSDANCGDITISGGTVEATGKDGGAGIGSGKNAKCSNILIQGGTVEATGGSGAAGIGSGRDDNADCGTVTITADVTKVTANKGSEATYSIGAGNYGTCGTVTIGCTLNNDGNPVGGTTGAISTSSYTYPAPASLITNPAVGQVIGSNGKNYAKAAAATEDGTTAVAVIAYVGSETGVAGYTHGLAIALADEGPMYWSTAMSTCGAKTAITGAMWCLPSQDQWTQMFAANTSYTGLKTTITTAGGTTLQDAHYWSSSEESSGRAYRVDLSNGRWSDAFEDGDGEVRACLAF